MSDHTYLLRLYALYASAVELRCWHTAQWAVTEILAESDQLKP